MTWGYRYQRQKGEKEVVKPYHLHLNIVTKSPYTQSARKWYSSTITLTTFRTFIF